MARLTSSTPPPEADFTERIVDIDVEEEMQGAFLEYAYSVIYSRALPDARDGLKPVQRRILFGMSELGGVAGAEGRQAVEPVVRQESLLELISDRSDGPGFLLSASSCIRRFWA
jgi:hypothetical protein